MPHGAAAAAIFLETTPEMAAVIGIGATRNTKPKINMTTFIRKPRFGRSFWSSGGLSSSRGLEEFFRQTLQCQDFTKLTPDVFIVATQLNARRKVIFGPIDSGADGDYHPDIGYYDDVSVSEALAASMSVPGMFEPFTIVNKKSGEGIEYIDGEVRETLSAHIARDVGVDLAVISNTWVPYLYQPDVGSVSSRGVFAVLNQALNQSMEQKKVRFRNREMRVKLTLEYLRLKGTNFGLSESQVEQLVQGAALTLEHYPVEEIRVEPNVDDLKFNWISAWSFKKEELQYAVDTGYQRAYEAVHAWWKNKRQRL